MKLNVITVSTRPGRIGPKVADWFLRHAGEHGKFEIVPVDLADFELPVFDEPKHPRLHDYQHEHTKRWSASVASADAFVFVTPEYNYFAPVSFVNAFTYLNSEWAYKPAGIVSYGGISGGLRAVQSERLLVNSLVKDGVFEPTQPMIDGATLMLDELAKWSKALKPMRAA